MNRYGWTCKKLGEVAIIINGKNQKAVEDSNGQYPICGSGGIMGYATDYLCPENCVIVGRKGNINRPLFMTQKFWNVDTAFGIKANEVDLVPKFLFYFCQSFDFQKLNKAVTIPSLVKSDLLKIELPIPSLVCQNNIVSELDSINESITMLQQQLKDLDSLAQSLFYDMFGDTVTNPKGFPLKKICEVGTIITGNTPSTKDSENYSSNDYCFVKPSDISKEGVADIQTSEFFISKKAYSNSRQLPKGSVLTTCIGIIGKVGILRKTATCNQQINAIVPNSDITSIYLAYAILGLRDVLEAMANAPVVPIINKGVFSMLQIPLPPLSLQHSFATKMASIEESKASLKAQITEMQNLLASRMQFWFD